MAVGEIQVNRTVYFDRSGWVGWPPPSELAPFFLAPKGREWSYYGRNDSWGMDIKGLYGTADLPEVDSVNVSLAMIGHPDHGVYLQYHKWDGRIRKGQTYFPRGDLTRLGEFVLSLHGTPLSVGLFIPFATAWIAVKEFMERDGELPTGIAWIAGRDLPKEAFRDPPRVRWSFMPE
jgi:hypothetical protein